MNQSTAQTPNPLGSEPITKLLSRYAVPSIISMVMMAVYNIVDQVFIGWGVGYLGIAATNVAFPLTTVALAIALACGAGCAANCNLEMGRGNHNKVPHIVGSALSILLVLGVALMAVMLIFLSPLLRATGATDEVLPYAIEYTTFIAIGMPFAMCSNALSHIIRSDGSPRYAMFSMVSGAVLNMILDPIFIFGLGLGVGGAGLATAISQLTSAVLALYYMARRTRGYTLTRAMLRPRWKILRRVFAYGSSSFINQISIFLVNVVLNNSLTYYGAQSAYGAEIPLAAMGIVNKINAILISCILGVAIGAQPILGYNYGAKNYDRVKKTYRTEIAVTVTLSVVVWLLFMTIPEVFVSAFGDEDPAFNQFAAMALSTYMAGVFCAGFQIPSANYFQAVGKPTRAMALTLTRQLVCLVTFILILPRFFGLEGILYAGPAADVLALIVTAFFIIREIRALGRQPAAAPLADEAPVKRV